MKPAAYDAEWLEWKRSVVEAARLVKRLSESAPKATADDKFMRDESLHELWRIRFMIFGAAEMAPGPTISEETI